MDALAARTGLQHLSHVSLIKRVRSSVGRDSGLDAIIVPAARPTRNLMTAIDLAVSADCHLVVLCSKEASPRKVEALFDAKNFSKGTAVQLRDDYSNPKYFQFETSEWMKASGESINGGRKSDLSLKRNIGLMVALMLRWRRILFLDDDIRGVSVDDLNHTVSLLGDDRTGNRSAGIPVKYFPDNSVVCHARRAIGERQEVFITGSVLAVNCKAPFSFFPDIYNEDWLFIYDDVANKRTASPDRHATKKQLQIAYNPFADPKRAAREEFGDVIAEGLYSLLHQRPGLEFTTKEYWENFIESRKDLLTEIREQLPNAPIGLRAEIEQSIAVAHETLRGIEPYMCVEYLTAWRRDLERWKKRLKEIPRKPSVAEALEALKVTPAKLAHGQQGRPCHAHPGHSYPNSDKPPLLCEHSGCDSYQGAQRERVADSTRYETGSTQGVAVGIRIGSRS